MLEKATNKIENAKSIEEVEKILDKYESGEKINNEEWEWLNKYANEIKYDLKQKEIEYDEYDEFDEFDDKWHSLELQ